MNIGPSSTVAQSQNLLRWLPQRDEGYFLLERIIAATKLKPCLINWGFVKMSYAFCLKSPKSPDRTYETEHISAPTECDSEVCSKETITIKRPSHLKAPPARNIFRCSAFLRLCQSSLTTQREGNQRDIEVVSWMQVWWTLMSTSLFVAFRCMLYLDTFMQHSFLWTDSLDKTFDRFLLEDHGFQPLGR